MNKPCCVNCVEWHVEEGSVCFNPSCECHVSRSETKRPIEEVLEHVDKQVGGAARALGGEFIPETEHTTGFFETEKEPALKDDFDRAEDCQHNEQTFNNGWFCDDCGLLVKAWKPVRSETVIEHPLSKEEMGEFHAETELPPPGHFDWGKEVPQLPTPGWRELDWEKFVRFIMSTCPVKDQDEVVSGIKELEKEAEMRGWEEGRKETLDAANGLLDSGIERATTAFKEKCVQVLEGMKTDTAMSWNGQRFVKGSDAERARNDTADEAIAAIKAL